MGRQRNIHSEEHLKRLRKSHAERPAGFYRKGGKTRPITKAKPKKTRVVKKVIQKKQGRYIYEFEDHTYNSQEQGAMDFAEDWIKERQFFKLSFVSPLPTTQ